MWNYQNTNLIFFLICTGCLFFYLFSWRKNYPRLGLAVVIPTLIFIIQNWLKSRGLENQISSFWKVQIYKIQPNFALIKWHYQLFLWNEPPIKLIEGQKLKITGHWEFLIKNSNSFSFDFANYLHQMGIFKKIKVEDYHMEITKNIRFYFFKWWQSHDPSPLLNLILFKRNHASIIPKLLQELGIGELLSLTMWQSFFWLNQQFRRWRPQWLNFRIQKFCWWYSQLILFFYLYLLNFQMLVLRFFLQRILKKIIQNRHYPITPQTRNFLILYLLSLYNSYFIFQSGLWFLTVAYLFFSPKRIANGNWENYWKKWFKGLIVFGPLQISTQWRWNLLSPILSFGLTPFFTIQNILVYCLWWVPGLELFWYFSHNFLVEVLKLSTYLSYSWNFGASPKMILIIYFCILFWNWNYSSGLRSWWLIGAALLVVLLLSWQKLFLESEALWMLNVGNGASFLYLNKWKGILLIYDCGAGPNYSPGIMADFLRYKGLNHADLVIISHYHQDHFNGLFKIKDTIRIYKLIDNQGPPAWIWNYKGLTVQGWHLSKTNDYNDTSVIVLLKTGSRNLFFSGDLTKKGEEIYLKNSSFVKVITNCQIHFFQIGHHGSQNATSEDFLTLVKPQKVLISAGLKNKHQFPDQSVLKLLKKLKIPFFSTHIKINWVFNLNTDKIRSFF